MSAENDTMRLRIRYGVAEPLCYTSVLDMGRHWERLLRRAKLPLAYSQGFHPHPRLFFAAPLPVGYRATDELLDVLLSESVQLADAHAALMQQSPQGLEITGVEEVPVNAPVLQAAMRAATYRVELWTDAGPGAIDRALAAFAERESVPRERERKGRTQHYDLRELFTSYARAEYRGVEPLGGVPGYVLEVAARCGSNGSGRPEELVEELGLPIVHTRVIRTGLIWDSQEEVTS